MSKSNNQKKAKLKANIEDFVEPLLKQLDNFPKNEVFSEIQKLVVKVKDVAAQARNRESEQISLMEEIERQLDYWKENKGDNGKLLENFNKILKKYNVEHLVGVSTDSIQEEATSPCELTKNNNQEYDSSIKLEELQLDQQHKDCLHILRIFPENTKMKKRLLIYWWIGLGIFPSENITNTMEQQGENIFSDLVSRGILVPVYTREHNEVIDQCIVNPTIHQQLSVRYQKTCCHGGGMSIYSDDEHNVRALLNVDQKYLSSKEIKNILGDNAKPLQVVSLGRWTCTTKVEVDDKIVSMGKKSPDHIELDGTDFLKKFGEKVTFLSLRGISGIDVLSKSIGELGDLRILDLRSCHNLEKLPQKPMLRLSQGKRKWFKNLTHLDMSECYLLDHMPKWICDLSNLEVLKGFVAGNAGRKHQFCQLGDLKKLKKLRKLSIKIGKHLDPTDASGLESLEQLSLLTVIWSAVHEHIADNGKVQTISFPKNLEKLDIRCYPKEEAGPAVLPNLLNRLYIIGGKVNKIVVTDSSRNVKILRLRFLKYLKIDWFELNEMFTNLEFVECKKCPNLTTFPRTVRGVCYPKKEEPIPIDDDDDDVDGDALSGRVELKIISNLEAPLDEHDYTLMLELTGNVCSDRPRLALVVVLDVCAKMNEDNKLEEMKTAIRFVINKLSSADCFSIVIFSKEATTLWPLQKMTETCKKEIEYVVSNLKADDTEPGGRFYRGLEMGLNSLEDPKISSRSMVKSIILVSSVAGDADYNYPDFSSVAVHTFGFGEDHGPWELMRIAKETIGGTYSSVRNTNNLTKAIAVCLAGLLTVVVQDLVLTFAPIEQSSALMDVEGAANSTWRKHYFAPVDVSYGNLYTREIRKVLVTLFLADVDEEGSTNILKASYSYKVSGKIFQSDPVIITANRMKMMSSEKLQVPQEVIAEKTRKDSLQAIQCNVDWYRSELYDNLRNSEDELCKLLCKDLGELTLLKSEGQHAYAQSLAYSILICHYVQRAVARGDNIEESIRSFGTPSMFKFLKDIENGEHLG